MALLLTYSQQIAIKKISANNQAKYDQIATEVENSELIDLLGVAQVQDLQNNPTTAANINLLNGSTFVDCRGNTVTQKGLRYVIAYLNYSKYLGESYVTDSFTGFVTKNRPDAELLSEGQTKRLMDTARKIAMTAFELIKEFLIKNNNVYPLYNQNFTNKVYTPKISGLRTTPRKNEIKQSQYLVNENNIINL